MRRIAYVWIFLTLVSVAWIGTGCSKAKTVGSAGPSGKVELLAEVGSRKITTEDFQNALANLPEDYKILAESEKGKHKILDNLIKKDLLVLEAEARGYHKDEAVKAKVKEMNQKSRERLQRQIEELQSRLDTVDRQVYENVLRGDLNRPLKKEGLKDFTVSESDVATYYQDYARKMKILNPSAKVPELAKVKAQIEAILVEEQLIKRLQKKSAVEVKEDVFQRLYGASAGAMIEDGGQH